VGRAFAESVGYPRALLDLLPACAVEAFTGVSNVSVLAEMAAGDRVLDLGSGAGLDALTAARRVGPDGHVVGIDFSDAMLSRAKQAAEEAGMSWVAFERGNAETVPLADSSIDVALINGIFNLNPHRGVIFEELARVVRQGGKVFAAELVLVAPPAAQPSSAADWFA
jgi:ubiquinone/menaquinone biosynthesis C-methylase UbiE